MLKKLTLTAILLSYFVNAHAYCINDALLDAYQNNSKFKSAYANYKQTVVEAEKGIYQMLPNASISATSNYIDFRQGFEKTNSINFNANYSIPLGGGKVHELKASKALKEFAEATLVQAEAETLLNAALAYIQYIKAYKTYEISTDTLNLMLKHYDIAQQKSELGKLNKVDLAKAKQQLAASKADTIKTKNKLSEAEAVYIHIIGVNPNKSIKPPTNLPPMPLSYNEAVDIAQHNSVSVRIAKSNELLARYKLYSAKSSVLPTLNLSFNLKQNIDSFKSSGVPPITSSSVMASLDVPIFQNGFQGYAQIKQAKLNSSKAFHNHIEAVSDMKEKVKSNTDGVQINKAFIEAAEESLSAAQTTRDAVAESYELQYNTVTDLLKSERDLLSEKLNLLNANTEYFLSAYRLLSSCGLLTFERLGIVTTNDKTNTNS
ncbi:exported hypothetical protein [Candidatus Xenohaliotis californiensis]|uniref:Uncharacterized protein n=1 Tax=Candidatus Xenohaliotis californiensis TaxID=84677 RepID=A0ABP0EWI4_9RICK|nr:exported hypothetical protein [Candidatus Xenohaliotis californiensis]